MKQVHILLLFMRSNVRKDSYHVSGLFVRG